MKPLIGIARVSSRIQLQGHSLESQTEEIHRFARAKALDVIDVCPLQVSGAKQTISNSQLSFLIKRAKKEKCDLVVSKLDRLSRDQLTLMMLRRAHQEYGVEIHICDMDQKISEIPDVQFQFLSFYCEHERTRIIDRIKAGCKGRHGGIGINHDPKEMAQKSINKRRKLAHSWAESIDFRNQILSAVSALKKPNLVNVCRMLNGEKVYTRRGSHWSPPALHQQIKRLGWSWSELTKG